MERVSVNHKSNCIRVWEGGRNGGQTYFTKKEYGSIGSAYSAAIKYESTLKPECRRGKKKPRTKSRSDSETGIVGVHPFKNRSKEIAGYRASWVQYVNNQRQQKGKDFSFFRHGNQAFMEAKKHRENMVGRTDYLYHEPVVTL